MSATSPTSLHLNSRAGVTALLDAACRQEESRLLIAALSPLLPECCPWTSCAALPPAVVKQSGPQLTRLNKALGEYRQGLTATAGQLAAWLEASDEDVREVALRYAQLRLPGQQKLAWAERRLGTAIPGKTLDSRWARINDARFWRRAIRVRLLREREHFYLRLNLIGRGKETYVSDQQLSTRTRQLRNQAQWMQDTVLVPRYLECGEQAEGPLTLAQVASSPKTRFAKLYAFTKAMDELAQAEGLAAGMLTLTLEPEWHPNPSHGTSSWNGATPRAGHQVIAKRWQSILRDLHRAQIGLSGLRVVEPHKDGCPHWHLWLLYRPEVETRLLATVMQYFPGKLKIRAPSRKGQKLHPDDRMYATRADLFAGCARAPSHAKEGSQIELSRIDRSISTGASYAMKYLLKTVDAGDQLNKSVDLFGNPSSEELAQQKKAHQESAQRVDAYRALWGINAGQLFGVAKCLSAWDELRRLGVPPANAQLHTLWVLARGSDQPGRIPKGAGQRGNPRAFLEALGGLAACGKVDKDAGRQSIERLTVAATNGYGEVIRRPKGLSLVERERVSVKKGQVDTDSGEIYERSGRRSVKSVIASVVTRTTEWVLASTRRTKELNPEWLAGKRAAAKAAFAQSGRSAKYWRAFLLGWASVTEPVMVQGLSKTAESAARMAQERAHQRDAASSPAGLGKQARGVFWSAMATAWENLFPAERFPAIASAEAPAPALSWPALLASWGLAPRNPIPA